MTIEQLAAICTLFAIVILVLLLIYFARMFSLRDVLYPPTAEELRKEEVDRLIRKADWLLFRRRVRRAMRVFRVWNFLRKGA